MKLDKKNIIKLFKITLITLLTGFFCLVLVVGVASVYLYRNQNHIRDLVLENLNQMQQGYAKLEKVYINPYKEFPYISIDLHHLRFFASQKDTLRPIYAFDDWYLGFDIWDILQGKYSIKRIHAIKGKLDIIRYKDGSYNLLLAKTSRKPSSGGEALDLSLKSLILEDITLQKTDFASNQFVQLHITKAHTKLDYTKISIENHLETTFELQMFRQDSMILFSNKHLHLKSDIIFETQKNFLTIRPSTFELEGGEYNLKGTVDLNKKAFIDLDIQGRKSDFKLITAFAPDYIYERLQSYKNKGDIYFKGKVLGACIDDTPKIDIEFGCKNAEFINPQQKNSIRDLNFAGFFTNGIKKDLTTCELRIKTLSGKPEESVFRGSFHIKNFLNPYISVDFHSKLDLATLQNFYPNESLKSLKGWMIVDMTIDELLDYNDVQGTLGKLKDGTDSRLILQDVSIQPTGYPFPIDNLQADVRIVDGKLVIKHFKGKIKANDFELSGDINNLAAYFHRQPADLIANLSAKSTQLDLKELLSFDKKMATDYAEVIKDLRFNCSFRTDAKYLYSAVDIPKGELIINELNFKLKNYPHTIHNTHLDFVIDSTDIEIKQMETLIDKTDLHFLGKLKNYHALFHPELKTETFELYLLFKSNQMNFDDLLTYKQVNYMPADYKHEIIKNMLLEMNLKMTASDLYKGEFYQATTLDLKRLDCKLQIHPLAFRDFMGHLEVKNNTLIFTDFQGKIGKSDFKTSGTIENFATVNDLKSKKVIRVQANNLDIDELTNYQAPETPKDSSQINHDAGFNIFTIPFPNLTIGLDIGTLKYHQYLLQQLKGNVRTTQNHYVYVDDLSMNTAGGNVGIKGYFNGSDPKKIYLIGDLQLTDLDLDRVFIKFDNFGQDYVVNKNLHGRMTAKIKSKVLMHTDLTPNLQDTEAHIEGTIKQGRMVNFAPFLMMSDFFADKDLNNIVFGELTNTFDYKNGTLSFPRMEISTNLGFIYLTGQQGIDLKMDYLVEVPLRLVKEAAWSFFFKKRKKQANVKVDAETEEIISSTNRDYRKFVSVNITGTANDYKIRFGRGKHNARKGK